MGSYFVVLPPPILQFPPGVVERQEPVRIQALRPQAPLERLDERVVGRLPGATEIERDVVLVGPQVEVSRDEFRSLIDPDGAGIADDGADPLERLDDVFAPIAQTRIDHRREPGEEIHHRQDPQLRPGRELVMDEVHGPRLLRVRGVFAVVAQLGLDAPFGRFRPQLQAEFAIDALGLLLVDHPSVPPQQHMNAAVAVAHPRLTDLFDLRLEDGLRGATRLVAVACRIQLQNAACAALRHLPLAQHLVG